MVVGRLRVVVVVPMVVNDGGDNGCCIRGSLGGEGGYYGECEIGGNVSDGG